jgi:VanZ family protein
MIEPGRFRLWLPVAACMAAIFYASSLQDPPVPSGVPDVDLHGAAYFGLMLLVVRAVARGTWAGVTPWALAVAWIVTVLYGATDEWHQVYVESRHAELRDLAADAIGAFVAGLVAFAAKARLQSDATAAD